MKQYLLFALLIWLLVANLWAFFLCWWDKRKAKRGQWRVPERRLMTLALLGGELGLWLGMQRFRHKTKHKKFTLGVPACFVLHLAIVIFVLVKVL